MSILNVSLSPTRAIVGVNTAIFPLNGAVTHGSKLFPLVHMNSALACRGAQPFFVPLCANCLFLGGATYDTLVSKIPELLSAAFTWALQHSVTVDVTNPDSVDKQQVALLGWSQSYDRMMGYTFIQEDRKTGFTRFDIDEYVLSPWDASFPECSNPENPKTPEIMARLARAQSRLLSKLESAPGAGAGGGRFIVAQLNQSSMTIAQVCDLDKDNEG